MSNENKKDPAEEVKAAREMMDAPRKETASATTDLNEGLVQQIADLLKGKTVAEVLEILTTVKTKVMAEAKV